MKKNITELNIHNSLFFLLLSFSYEIKPDTSQVFREQHKTVKEKLNIIKSLFVDSYD